MIKQGETVILDNDKSYLVVATADLNDEKYLFLVNEADQDDIKIAAEEDGETGKEVAFLGDDEDVSEILRALYKNGAEEYNKMATEHNNSQNNNQSEE